LTCGAFTRSKADKWRKPPPAERWQEPNPFSGRGFIVVVYGGGVWWWCMVYGDATEKDWVEKKKQKKTCREVFHPGKEVAGT